MAEPQSPKLGGDDASDVVRALHPRAESDAVLVNGLLAGDLNAKAAFFERYAPAVERLITRLIGFDREIPDILQEVFVHALASIHGLRNPAALRPWLLSIATHCARQTLRSSEIGGGSGVGGAPTNSGGASNGGAGAANAGAANGGAGGASKGGAGGMSAGGSTGAAGAGGATTTPPHTGVWRITPLGDSITGTTCGPQLLSKELKDKGHTNFIFVGSNLNNQSCNGAANVQTEGHGGYLVTDLVGNGQHAAELPQWTSSDKADIVLMHFGTNDVWNNIAPALILSAYSTVLSDLRSANSGVIVFVAQIIPMNPAGCAQCEARVEALNAQIPGWASSQSTAASPIYVVDQHSVFTPATYTPSSTYTADGVHPNVAGGQLMADKWYAALTAHALP
jgi:lysophospholipase L1-like esterase